MHSIHRTNRSALTPRLVGLAAVFAFAPLAFSQVPPESDTTDPTAAQPTQPAQTPSQATTPTPQQSVQVPEEKINQFAEAYVAVEGIQTQAAQQISSAADQEAANAVKVNAETEMIKAVERSGLKVEEFNEIVQAMTADVELRTKVVEKIEQRRRG